MPFAAENVSRFTDASCLKLFAAAVPQNARRQVKFAI